MSTGKPEPGYRIEPGAADSPVILHVPHASTVIPASAREALLLGPDELTAELAAMTDAYTDILAARAAAAARRTPWSFVNAVSRLVVDPERFPDDREDMRAVGMGAVYTRTSHGAPLRLAEDPALLHRYFSPYAQALSDLVDARLAATGRATIIDVHSYPTRRLPYERGGGRRPAVCLGTDAWHTAPWLVAGTREAFAGCGEIAENTPFAGCYIPLTHLHRDHRVNGVMVEIRRDVYLREPGGRFTSAANTVVEALTRLVDTVTAHAGDTAR